MVCEHLENISDNPELVITYQSNVLLSKADDGVAYHFLV